jgi:hypothetical protein
MLAIQLFISSQSLERMVIDLVQEKGHLNEQELSAIRQTIRDGDLSMVLREYEQEMKVQ